MDQLAEIDQEITKNWLSQIKSNSWQKQREPHPNSILHRTGGVCEEFGIDVINDYHAFCKPCLEHIYSNTNPSDPQSFVFRHANSEKHKFLLKSHSKKDIFIDKNDSIYCSVCNCDLQKSHFTQFESLDVRIKNHAMSSSHRDNAFLWNDGNMCILVSIAHSVPFMTYLKDGSCGICFVSVKNKAEHIESYCHLLTLAKYLQTCFYLSVEQLQNEETLTYLMVEMIKWMRDSGMDPGMETQADMDEVPAGEDEYLEYRSVIQPENVAKEPPELPQVPAAESERERNDMKSQLVKAIDLLSDLLKSYQDATKKDQSPSLDKLTKKETPTTATKGHSSKHLQGNPPSSLETEKPEERNGFSSSKQPGIKFTPTTLVIPPFIPPNTSPAPNVLDSPLNGTDSGGRRPKPLETKLPPVPKEANAAPKNTDTSSQSSEVKNPRQLISAEVWLKGYIGCGLNGGLIQVPHPQLMTRTNTKEVKNLAIENFPKFVDVLTFYHAYCVACGVHLYGSAAEDVLKADFLANYSAHYNSPRHLENENNFDPAKDMLVWSRRNKLHCQACNVAVVKDEVHQMQRLDNLIKAHLKLPGHQKNCVLVRDYLKQWISDNLSYFAGLDPTNSAHVKKSAEKALQMLDPVKETRAATSDTKKAAPQKIRESQSGTEIESTPQWFQVPVPQMVAHRNNGTSVQNLRVKFPQKHLDFVNGSHAYCAICDLHIYSDISVKDIYSQYSSHVNDVLHIALLRHMVDRKMLSPDQPFLKEIQPRKTAFCEVCQKDLKADGPRRPSKSLQEDVTEHLRLKH